MVRTKGEKKRQGVCYKVQEPTQSVLLQLQKGRVARAKGEGEKDKECTTEYYC